MDRTSACRCARCETLCVPVPLGSLSSCPSSFTRCSHPTPGPLPVFPASLGPALSVSGQPVPVARPPPSQHTPLRALRSQALQLRLHPSPTSQSSQWHFSPLVPPSRRARPSPSGPYASPLRGTTAQAPPQRGQGSAGIGKAQAPPLLGADWPASASRAGGRASQSRTGRSPSCTEPKSEP